MNLELYESIKPEYLDFALRTTKRRIREIKFELSLEEIELEDKRELENELSLLLEYRNQLEQLIFTLEQIENMFIKPFEY